MTKDVGFGGMEIHKNRDYILSEIRKANKEYNKMFTITVNRIRLRNKYDENRERGNLWIRNKFIKFIKDLPDDYDDDTEISIIYVLDKFGIESSLEALSFVFYDKELINYKMANKLALSFAIQCAESVLHIFEGRYPNDNTARLGIRAAKDVFSDKYIDMDIKSIGDCCGINGNYDHTVCENSIYSKESSINALRSAGKAFHVAYWIIHPDKYDHNDYCNYSIFDSAVAASISAINASSDKYAEEKKHIEILRSLLNN